MPSISTIHINSTDYDVKDATARTSIDNLATVASTGSYDDLTDKPVIPEGSEASSTTPKMDGSASTGSETKFARGDHVHPTDTSRAPIASPTFSGTPRADTAPAGTNTTQIATTAFVKTAVDNAISGAVVFKGTKTSVSAIKALTNVKQGWMYIVSSSDDDNGQEWVATADIGSTASAASWEMLGTLDVGDLGDFAYVDEGTATFTPSGSFSKGTLATTTVNSITNVGTLPTHAADTFTQGSLPSFTEGEFSPGTLPSFTRGSFSQGTLPTHAADTFTQGSLPSWSASVESEVLTFTFSAGTLPTYSQGTFSQGTLPTHAADTWDAGSLPSKEEDTFSAGSLPTFTQGTFSQGTLPTKGSNTTVATGSWTTDPSWSGTEQTITISPKTS